MTPFHGQRLPKMMLRVDKQFIRWYNKNIHLTRSADEKVASKVPIWLSLALPIRYRIIHILWGVDYPIEMYKKYAD